MSFCRPSNPELKRLDSVVLFHEAVLVMLRRKDGLGRYIYPYEELPELLEPGLYKKRKEFMLGLMEKYGLDERERDHLLGVYIKNQQAAFNQLIDSMFKGRDKISS